MHIGLARIVGRTFKDPHGSWVVVDSSRSFQCSGYDGGRGYEIVGKSVVQVALRMGSASVFEIPSAGIRSGTIYLELENVLHSFELLFISVG